MIIFNSLFVPSNSAFMLLHNREISFYSLHAQVLTCNYKNICALDSFSNIFETRHNIFLLQKNTRSTHNMHSLLAHHPKIWLLNFYFSKFFKNYFKQSNRRINKLKSLRSCANITSNRKNYAT
jgi:hypothetical protein